MKLKTHLIIVMATVATTFFLSTHANAAAQHPAGTLIQSGQAIWRINEAGTSRHPIDSVEKFYSHRFAFKNVVPATTADMALPETSVLPWGDGVLFTDTDEVIYQISGGQKHGFISADVFLGQGFNFTTSKPGNLSSIPTGEPIRSASARHLPGTLVYSPSNGLISRIDSASNSSAFPSSGIFFSHGGAFTEIVNANAADAQSFTSSTILSYRPGTIVNDNGALWAVTTSSKLGFPTAHCFLDFGYSFAEAIVGATATIPSAGTICGDAPAAQIPTPGPISTYEEKIITTGNGNFSTKIASFNLASGKFRIITDTASDKDCTSNCPVASLNTFAKVNGAQSGINGTYFCPSDYAECRNQSNSFFWKVIDTNLNAIINKSNGLGELDPFIGFDRSGTALYFRTWNDYTVSPFKATAGINSAGLIENKSISLNYDKLDNKQRTTKAVRGLIGLQGQTLYLIHVLGATVPDAAEVAKSIGLDNAITIDGGGAAAMIYNSTSVSGPGRLLPNALLVQQLP